MNGAHDMGGMHGFGPIEIEPDEPLFHGEWERRAFALTLAAGALGRWSIDGGRHAREVQPPAQYLDNTYYEQWLHGLEVLLVKRGIVTEEELSSGKAQGPTDPALLKRVLRPENVSIAMGKGSPYTRPEGKPARFKFGDRVRVLNNNPTGHTRAPRYARGHTGEIVMEHGIQVFPDSNAAARSEGGNENPQPLYNVRFSAIDLWGEDHAVNEWIHIDLWDDYLEPA
jgi:nitrile hydratase subunit beta